MTIQYKRFGIRKRSAANHKERERERERGGDQMAEGIELDEIVSVVRGDEEVIGGL